MVSVDGTMNVAIVDEFAHIMLLLDPPSVFGDADKDIVKELGSATVGIIIVVDGKEYVSFLITNPRFPLCSKKKVIGNLILSIVVKQ